jgi:DNA-binding transcriptional ArsR family regulator
MAALYGGDIPRFKRALYQIAFHQGVFTSLCHVPTKGNRSRPMKLMPQRMRNFPVVDMQPDGCVMFRLMDAVFKALADPSRRKLLDELHKDNGQTLGELCEHLDMTRQAVTKHLALLEKANLVAVVWRGREKLHYLNPTPLHEIYERWIGKYERHRLEALSDLKKGLEQTKAKKRKAK